MSISWKTQGAVAPETLSEARLQLHFAVGLAAAPGHIILDHRDDYSEGTLTWNHEQGLIVGEVLSGNIQAALDPEKLRILLQDQSGTEKDGLDLAGKTNAEALLWLKEALEKQGLKVDELRTPMTDYEAEMPEHELGKGAAYKSPDQLGGGLQELSAYYSNAALLLAVEADELAAAGPLKIWPHHFDIATLATYPGEKETDARYMGLGFSPGDETYPQPYYYITAYPYPEDKTRAELASGGFWHDKGWLGAILTGEKLLGAAHKNGDAQRKATKEFLKTGKAGAGKVLKL